MKGERLTDVKDRLADKAILALLALSSHQPTEEKLRARAESYAQDASISAHVWYEAGAAVGILVTREVSPGVREILGVATHPAHRLRGIGEEMILAASELLRPDEIVAETDDEAVGFYRRCGFAVTSLGEKYPGTVRYRCVLSKEGQEMARFARDANALGDYLALRDIGELSPRAVRAACGGERADVLILFGGSILHGIDAAARAWREGVAERLMIVGGVGHTTQALRDAAATRCPGLHTAGRPEADVIADYLALAHGIPTGTALIENRSANCGENASFARELALEAGLRPRTALLMQDSTMQRRMDATLKKEWAALGTRFLSFAAYRARLVWQDERLAYRGEPIGGMWEPWRYIELLMGEIPRLRDDEGGYGPRGKGYLVHVDIPCDVERAFGRMRAVKGEMVRPAWK